MTEDINKIFLGENFLIRFKNELRKQQENIEKSYVPTRAKFYNKHDKGDLDTRFQQADYDEIISNSDEYFEKVTITNFDLIHQQCRGDKQLHDRKYY